MSTEELTELAAVTKSCGAVFVTHVRPVNKGHEEVCSIAKKLGVRTQCPAYKNDVPTDMRKT